VNRAAVKTAVCHGRKNEVAGVRTGGRYWGVNRAAVEGAVCPGTTGWHCFAWLALLRVAGIASRRFPAVIGIDPGVEQACRLLMESFLPELTSVFEGRQARQKTS
jgi:hypothetical protein